MDWLKTNFLKMSLSKGPFGLFWWKRSLFSFLLYKSTKKIDNFLLSDFVLCKVKKKKEYKKDKKI